MVRSSRPLWHHVTCFLSFLREDCCLCVHVAAFGFCCLTFVVCSRPSVFVVRMSSVFSFLLKSCMLVVGKIVRYSHVSVPHSSPCLLSRSTSILSLQLKKRAIIGRGSRPFDAVEPVRWALSMSSSFQRFEG